MVTIRKELGGGCVAWYATEDEASILVWVAPADGAWAVYLEGLPGAPRRCAGIATEAEAVAMAEALVTVA